MPATILNMSDPSISLPEYIVLDASVILQLYPPSNPTNKHRQTAINFLYKLQREARKGNVVPVVPRLVLEECYFKFCQQFLMQLAALQGLKWHQLYKKSPVLLRSIHPALEGIYNSLKQFPVVFIEPEDLSLPHPTVSLSQRMGELIQEFKVLPKDATILSEAERMGIYTVATMDNDWKRAEHFTLIIPRSA